jgi:hypothetical protein
VKVKPDDRELVDKTIKAVCNEFNIKLVDMSKLSRKEQGKMGIKGWPPANSSVSDEDDGVVLGRFGNQELRLISFLHEVGHCLGHEQFKGVHDYAVEAHAWSWAIRLASQKHISFSDEALAWAHQQLGTYANNQE